MTKVITVVATGRLTTQTQGVLKVRNPALRTNASRISQPILLIMKTKVFFQTLSVAVVFSGAFVGINITLTKTYSANTQNAQVSVISLGTQSMAYCKAPEQNTEAEMGICSGNFDSLDTRCLKSSGQPVTWGCVLD
ncbi:MAG TPA: hypothetical protein VKB19_00175 [Pedobacter sp.]|nr:hypothetical protein [Pedobacter sp.]